MVPAGNRHILYNATRRTRRSANIPGPSLPPSAGPVHAQSLFVAAQWRASPQFRRARSPLMQTTRIKTAEMHGFKCGKELAVLP